MKNLFRLAIMATLIGLLAACTGSATTKSTGDIIDDALIETKVKTALARDERVSALDVTVEVFKGVVQLSGFVDGEEAVAAAEEAAYTVNGVVEVKNRLDLKGQ